MRRTGSRNGLRDGGRKAQKRCSVLPEPGSGGSEMTSAADGVKKRPARWRPEGTETMFCLAGTGRRRQRDDKRGGRQDTGVEREKRRRKRQASKTRRRKRQASKTRRQPVNQGGQRGGGGNAGQKKAAAGNLPPQGTLPRPVYWAMQMLTRFCSTPGKGWTVSPLPSAAMRSAAMPACSNAAATPAARCRESFRLMACEPVAASA